MADFRKIKSALGGPTEQKPCPMCGEMHAAIPLPSIMISVSMAEAPHAEPPAKEAGAGSGKIMSFDDRVSKKINRMPSGKKMYEEEPS